MPPSQILALRLAHLLAPLVRLGIVQRLVERRIARSVPGPDEATRRTARTQLWGRVTDDAGRSVDGTLVTPESYRLTAETAVESARRVVAGKAKPGFQTPSLAFGPGFISEFDGCDLRIAERLPR